jgi:hypothetical protein
MRKGLSRRTDTDRSTILLTPLVMRLLASADNGTRGPIYPITETDAMPGQNKKAL